MPLVVQAAHTAWPAADTRASGLLAQSGARLAHGDLMVDGLQRRLGEIRNVMPTRDSGGEVFARYVSGAIEPSGGRIARVRAGGVQLGGSLVLWNEDGASHRMGGALDRGMLRGNAAVADEPATAFSVWYTHQRAWGGYVDAVLSRTRHAGAARQGDAAVAKTGASQWIVSAEAGAPLQVGENLAIEPRIQLKHQSLRLGVARVDSIHRTTARLGARLARIDNERFVPYVQADLERRAGARIDAALPDAATGAGRGGTSMRFSAGFTIKLTRSIDVHADARLQKRLAGSGDRGSSFNAGLRINF